MGAFSTWQPQYAAHGVVVFPVVIEPDGIRKRPAVKGYTKLGPDQSARLVHKFPHHEALGFMCGPRNRVSVLDVDTQDEGILADALAKHGETPIIVRTAREKWQAWYRYNGERRLIRPWLDLPIDLIGGGFVVAPPSKGQDNKYEFAQGRLDDIDNLPVMRAVDSPAKHASNRNLTPVGKRNDTLFRYALVQARHCDDVDALLDCVRTENEFSCQTPLSDNEIVGLTYSAWRYEERGRNFAGSGKCGKVVQTTGTSS